MTKISNPRWRSGFVHVGLVVSFFVCACTPQGDAAIGGEGFSDDFNRDALGKLWTDTGGGYRIVDGQLTVRGARNRPLWLRRTLPRDVRIEFDVKSDSDEGDIKIEVFGDGASKATSASYTATSYVIVFGGWGNTKNVIARMDEHGRDRAVGKFFPVEKGRTYRMAIERQGSRISAWIDGRLLAQMDDPEPLWGRGHDHFAFNNWQSQLSFDNLTIRGSR